MPCTHHTSSIPYTSITVTLTPSHSLSRHTCMQHKQQYTHHSHNNHRIHIGYYDNLTDRPKTTTGPQTPHKDTVPAVKVREISSYCRSTLTESKTNSRSSNCLFSTHYADIITIQETKLTPKANTPKYITSPLCVPIGCTMKEVGSLHSFETIHGRHTESVLAQTTILTNIHTANIMFTNGILMADKHNIPKGKMHRNCRLLPDHIVCKLT